MSFAPLQLANGPECPRCGCRDSSILRAPAPVLDDGEEKWHWGTGGGSARCKHCGNQFSFREIPAPIVPIADPVAVDEAMGEMEFDDADRILHEVVKPRDTAYPVRECPECGSPSTKVYRTMKEIDGVPRLRYHRCLGCHETFKSADSRHC